ncbi:MAG: Co2+/Mg2+ efflux protein ApaG [Magnetococcales bacterium]|nr:Co2+/Mg2+ efflux protein ApaG [Magnetococcales bacterium]
MSDLPSEITVEVMTRYIAERSKPDDDRYAFAYTITIRNEGPLAVQLLRRHWLISSHNGRIQEVMGEGVVGEQPWLNPGQSFSYTSWAMIETQTGEMSGKYYFTTEQGEGFWAEVPAFFFIKPEKRVLH